MPNYCIDTSGLSNPWETLPEDIYGGLWGQIYAAIAGGAFCCNVEIFQELQAISGGLGECVNEHADSLVLEIGHGSWPWEDYIEQVEALQKTHNDCISEYNGNRKGTVGLNDVSIVALAKVLELPLISMEKANVYQPSTKKRRIPDICKLENVIHMDFNDFLRKEGIKL